MANGGCLSFAVLEPWPQAIHISLYLFVSQWGFFYRGKCQTLLFIGTVCVEAYHFFVLFCFGLLSLFLRNSKINRAGVPAELFPSGTPPPAHVSSNVTPSVWCP